MKRVQLFEFEDFGWFPSWFRSCMTRVLAVLHKVLGTQEVVSHLLREVREKHTFSQVVDMGSGAGGIMPDVMKQLNSELDEPVALMLTDLHPNQDLIQIWKDNPVEHVSYREISLDATALGDAPEGLKTMMNSFHHMTPTHAKHILRSAYENQQPILIYEMGENMMPLVLWWLQLPIQLLLVGLSCLFLTPLARPLTLRQIVFTYLIPIIPLVYAWDGAASMPRTYTFDDVNEMLDAEGLRDSSYQWEIAHAKRSNGKKLGYYVLGLPQAS